VEFEGAKWVIGVVLTAGGLIIAGFYRLGSKMSGQHTTLHKRIDDVKDKYVRRDDFDKHITRLEATLQHVDEKLDRLIARE
jgi:hypothetical protein